MTDKTAPCLWFNGDGRAKEAAELYVSLIPNSRIVSDRHPMVVFELDGRRYMILDAGPMYTLSPALSIYVDCDDQAEIDSLWAALLDGGGQEIRCGWLTDRFGVSWQIIPKILPVLFADPDRAAANRAMEAMMAMQKIDIASLQRAFDGA